MMTSAEILDVVDSWQVVARACGENGPILTDRRKRENMVEALGVTEEMADVLIVADDAGMMSLYSSESDPEDDQNHLTGIIRTKLQLEDAQMLAKVLLERARQFHIEQKEKNDEALRLRHEQADAEFWPQIGVGVIGVLVGLVVCTVVAYGGFALAWEFLFRWVAKIAFLGGSAACVTGAVLLYRELESEGDWAQAFCGGGVLGSFLGAVLALVLLMYNF